jgi:hypothetical protein
MQNALIAAVTALVITAIPVLAQDEPMPDSAALAEMQEALMESARPGPEHQLLASLEGEWDLDVKIWMHPGAAPVETAGKGANEMILGGRWLKWTTVGDLMGQPVESFNMIGFDRRHKKFVMVGFDDLGTYYIAASGTYDEESRTVLLAGTDEDPIFDMTQEYEFAITFVDDSTYNWSLTFFNPEMTQGLDSLRMVEVVYTRR